MQLQYDALYTGVSGTLRKDGNISQAVWRVRGRERQAYSYTYDGLQRISTASYSDISEAGTVTASNRYNTSYTYADLRGNFSNVQRNGQFLSGSCYTQALLDNMTYSYNAGTNQISSISDAANATQGGYRAASGAFTYDVNGNIKTYAAKGISNINYNHLNLPTLIDFGGGKVIEFTYSSGGNKLKKVVKNTGGSILYTEDYVEGIEYKNGIIEAIYHKEGRLYNNTGTWQREYSIRDHLGNTRLTYADLNNDGVIATPSEILQENSYDPFGSSLDGVWMNHALPDNQYQYNKKELQTDFGISFYDFGKRFFDPGIDRFTGIDPISDKFPYVSTYNYAENDPISNIDLWGLQKYRFDGSNTVDKKGLIQDVTDKQATQSIQNALIRITFQLADILGLNQLDNSLYDLINGNGNRTSKLFETFISANSLLIPGKIGEEPISPQKNPFGAKGKPDHQAKVGELAAQARENNPGMDIITEKKINNPNSNRRPDVQVVDPATGQTTKIYEAERRPESKRNQDREAEYNRLRIFNQTIKVEIK